MNPYECTFACIQAHYLPSYSQSSDPVNLVGHTEQLSLALVTISGTQKFSLSIKSDVLKLDATQELKACEQRPEIISRVFLQWLVYTSGNCM